MNNPPHSIAKKLISLCDEFGTKNIDYNSSQQTLDQMEQDWLIKFIVVDNFSQNIECNKLKTNESGNLTLAKVQLRAWKSS